MISFLDPFLVVLDAGLEASCFRSRALSKRAPTISLVFSHLAECIFVTQKAHFKAYFELVRIPDIPSAEPGHHIIVQPFTYTGSPDKNGNALTRHEKKITLNLRGGLTWDNANMKA